MKIKNIDIEKHLGKIDLFILSSGFEERSKTLSNSLNKENISNVLLFHLKDNYAIAEKNKLEIISMFNLVNVVDYPKNDSFNTFNLFYQKIDSLLKNVITSDELNIVVDATAFSREILLIMIRVLTRPTVIEKINLTIIHTPVEDYSAEDGLWLTKGVREIRPIFGFSGIMTPSKKLLLVVFNGFEEERTEIIIESFEPNALILANPSKKGSVNENLKKIVDLKYECIKAKFKNILKEEVEFSCLEIKNTIDLLEEIFKKYSDEYNIAISPLNNKVSTIAIAIASIKNEAFQVCYASANQYNIHKKLIPSRYFLVYNLNSFL